MNVRKLKTLLDAWTLRINTPAFIEHDPVRFPRRYRGKQDVEIAAFLSAAIAWGRRDLILRSAEKMFLTMGKSPYSFIMEGAWKRSGRGRGRSIHRTFFEDDFEYYCRGLNFCYTQYGDLENLFAEGIGGGGVFEGIRLFRETMALGNGGREGKPLYSKHVSNPGSSSACKRINLALRWLVRKDGIVDTGIWKRISPSSLYIPLDLHAGRTARQLGLLERKGNDRRAVEELTEKLREFSPEDPVRYDFALFGIGMAQSGGR
ncbi:MAG: TIGR02757 family protein [Treponema sp.]|nr:TIGR02757 family protein [Treponema sp.]